MTYRKLILACATALVVAIPGFGGTQNPMHFVLFAGGNPDSTEQPSIWIPVYGASRVVIKTWSEHVAWAADNADSTRSDSLTTFDVLLSDSVLFIARDSLGTTVTSRSGIPRVSGSHGEPYPMCADSIVVAAGDSAKSGVVVGSRPINKELRAPSNGTGLVTVIGPVVAGAATADPNGMIAKSYLRIRCTPLRRMTVSGFSSTQGKRVNGLKGLRMHAYVYYGNK